MIDIRLIAPGDPSPHRTSSHAVLKMGLYIGASLVIVMFGALVAANRFPSLERYALERDAISYSVFVILMLVPVGRFLKHPWQMFASSMIAWVMFAAAYDVAGFFFTGLFNAVLHTPFQVLIEGTIVYGVLAISSWVVQMVLYARHHPLTPRRRACTRTVRHVR